MMNAHVELFYRLLCLQAEARGKQFAQIHYYTLAMLESDPNWSPYKLENIQE
ncbi:hypothetical protein JWZ98_03265 [Methylomonas sp. EFPC1]|uniref:hypothetical protein n=1 Tax=Methylomonas sp. EFPC1 TaxID=2812647 RepID=UPI001967E3D8|nr:hypothetical protein [Methylomonas sp. EFPC1]QSB01995.1 hypothetical protein JWZ98_03265 [Methylomonas sp. EFPC1]